MPLAFIIMDPGGSRAGRVAARGERGQQQEEELFRGAEGRSAKNSRRIRAEFAPGFAPEFAHANWCRPPRPWVAGGPAWEPGGCSRGLAQVQSRSGHQDSEKGDWKRFRMQSSEWWMEGRGFEQHLENQIKIFRNTKTSVLIPKFKRNPLCCPPTLKVFRRPPADAGD